MSAFNSLIDFLFGVDIILNFRTSYINQRTGEEVLDPKKIARNYLCSSRFVIDLLASIPIDTIAQLLVSSENDTIL